MSISEPLPRPVDIKDSGIIHGSQHERRREAPHEPKTTGGEGETAKATQRDCDRTIKTQLKAELEQSGYSPLRNISCDVCQFVVTLGGRVPSFHLKQIAQMIVLRRLSDDWVIDNQLKVQRTYDSVAGRE